MGEVGGVMILLVALTRLLLIMDSVGEPTPAATAERSLISFLASCVTSLDCCQLLYCDAVHLVLSSSSSSHFS